MRALPLHPFQDPGRLQTPPITDLTSESPVHSQIVSFQFGFLSQCDVGQHSRCLAVVSVSPKPAAGLSTLPGRATSLERRSHTPHTTQITCLPLSKRSCGRKFATVCTPLNNSFSCRTFAGSCSFLMDPLNSNED